MDVGAFLGFKVFLLISRVCVSSACRGVMNIATGVGHVHRTGVVCLSVCIYKSHAQQQQQERQ